MQASEAYTASQLGAIASGIHGTQYARPTLEFIRICAIFRSFDGNEAFVLALKDSEEE